MNKMKRIVCWLAAVVMLVTFGTTFCFAAGETLATYGITLDESYTVTGSGTTFTVKLPDGRPRVPQVSATSGTVRQAFLPDDAAVATAKVTQGDTKIYINFQKTPSVGFVLQYDDYYTFNPGFTGATFTSSNTSVATVTSAGVVHIVAVSNSPVTITATKGSQTKTLTITKTIRAVLGIWMLTGQSNAAVNYYDKTQAIAPKAGTAMYYGWQFAANSSTITYSLPSDFVPMTKEDGTANVASNEPGLASTLYNKMGEKVLMLNGAISGTGIAKFLPGCGTDVKTYTWAHTNEVFEGAEALWSASSFQSKYETRIRSFFFMQGEAEVGSLWSVHYNGFAVNKNTNAFTSRGVNYPVGSHTWFSYMTDILGFDNCFDILIGWRPVGITRSTRTAQLKLAEDFDNYYIATRINQTFSEDEGTLRYDNLHNSQIGRNYLGQSAAATAATVYVSDGEPTERAASVVAYFDKSGYANGSTFYVKAGDFYNFCPRVYPYDCNDVPRIEIVGGDNIVEYDGVNDFQIKKTAPKGSRCTLKIYSGVDDPIGGLLTTVNICVIGDGASGAESTANVYSWNFSGSTATRTAGDINLVDSGLDNGSFALSRDLTLSYDGYWSIEWQATNTATMSMLASSNNDAATANSDGGKPNFMFIYYHASSGWRLFRDTAYTEYFWKTYNGGTATGTHTYKIECSDHVYSLSIDGVVSETKHLVQGHGSYASDSSYSPKGYYSDQFNLHYILGGINNNGISSTHYKYNGTVSYLKITMDDTRAITKLGGGNVTPEAGAGTKANPYVISATVERNSIIDDSFFTTTAPTDALTVSASRFGGTAIGDVICDQDTTTLYAMVAGTKAEDSKFYRVDLIASGEARDPLFNMTVSETETVAMADPAGRYSVLWRVTQATTDAFDTLTGDIKVLDYGLMYAPDIDTLSRFIFYDTHHRDTTGLSVAKLKYDESDTGLARICSGYTFRVNKLKKNKARAAAPYIRYELDGEIYTEYGALDATSTILDGYIHGIGPTHEESDGLDD